MTTSALRCPLLPELPPELDVDPAAAAETPPGEPWLYACPPLPPLPDELVRA